MLDETLQFSSSILSLRVLTLNQGFQLSIFWSGEASHTFAVDDPYKYNCWWSPASQRASIQQVVVP